MVVLPATGTTINMISLFGLIMVLGTPVLAITIVPVLMALLVRGKILPEHKNPLSRFLIWAYQPFIHFVLRYPKIVILTAAIATVVTFLPYQRLGSEFIPPLYEGDFLWMPTTDPGISITKSRELLQQTNKVIRQFPEVHHTFGKIGRAETSTDATTIKAAKRPSPSLMK